MSTDKDAQAFPVAGLASLPNGDFIHPGAGLTAREYAAIKLRVPDSGTDWLDKMILESMRDELAARAMQGLSRSGKSTLKSRFPKACALQMQP